MFPSYTSWKKKTVISSHLYPCRIEKNNLSFYFHTSLMCLKGFYEGLWDTTKKCEKISVSFISIRRDEAGRIKSDEHKFEINVQIVPTPKSEINKFCFHIFPLSLPQKTENSRFSVFKWCRKKPMTLNGWRSHLGICFNALMNWIPYNPLFTDNCSKYLASALVRCKHRLVTTCGGFHTIWRCIFLMFFIFSFFSFLFVVGKGIGAWKHNEFYPLYVSLSSPDSKIKFPIFFIGPIKSTICLDSCFWFSSFYWSRAQRQPFCYVTSIYVQR